MLPAGACILLPGVPHFRQHVYRDEALDSAIEAARHYRRVARIGPLPAGYCDHCLEQILACEGCGDAICQCIDEQRPRSACRCYRCTVLKAEACDHCGPGPCGCNAAGQERDR